MRQSRQSGLEAAKQDAVNPGRLLKIDSDFEDPGSMPDSTDLTDSTDEPDTQPLDSMHLWEGDAGTLPHDARSALLRLVRGPYISELNDLAQWRALLNYTEPIKSHLANMFLDLIVDAESGVAFAKNISVDGKEFPKAATSYTLTLLDTIMVLLLRKELQTAAAPRVFIGQADLFLQMNQYRNIAKMDQAAYLKALERSWSRLEERRLLVKSDVEGRYEISPVLKLVFGAEEARAVFEEYERLRNELTSEIEPVETHQRNGHDGWHDRSSEQDSTPYTNEGGTLFDGLL